mgnify:CR=1 FL=1
MVLKNCPAQRHDSVHSLPIENDVIARRQQPFKAIAKTNHFPAELVRCQHYGAQNRIKPRTIATAGQNTNARFHFRDLKGGGLQSAVPRRLIPSMRGFIYAIAQSEDFLDQPSAPQPPIDRTAASRVALELRLLRTG